MRPFEGMMDGQLRGPENVEGLVEEKITTHTDSSSCTAALEGAFEPYGWAN